MARRGMTLALAAAGSLAVAFLAGCSAETRERLLPLFFDGVTKEGQPSTPPPTRRVRRDLLREIEELKRELAEAREAAKTRKEGAAVVEAAPLPVEQAKTWEDAARLLPKDSAGSVDWIQALKTGTIAPRPGLDPKAQDEAVLPLDVELTPAGAPAFKVVFPHGAHTTWLACANCHPGIFQMAKGADPITMEKIYAGEYCGACHGKVAFPVTTCGRCHPAMAGGS